MFLPLVLLSSLLFYASGDLTTKILTHSSKSLKIKCDALPYRTVYHKTDCYIIVDVDGSGANAKCRLAMRGSKLARSDTPDAVFASLFTEKSDVMLDGDSSNQKKALCWYGPIGTKIVSDFRCADGTPQTKEGTCTFREEETNPIKYKIMLPHLARFTERVELEQTIVIKGLFSTYNLRGMIITDSFEIRLSANTDWGHTVPFHFKIDFKGNKVTMAHKRHTMWIGNETLSASPFKMGQPFDIRIKIRSDHFQILVDKQEFATYNHYLPFETISHLLVDGAGYITYVKIGEQYKPVPGQSASSTLFSQFCNQRQCGRSLDTPFLNPARSPQCAPECTTLRISGVVNDYHTRPTTGSISVINLVRGNDFPFSMDLRWFTGCPMGGWLCPHHSHTCLAYYVNGKWVSADFELFGPIPARAGDERFDLEIKSGEKGYEVYLNGVHAYTFRHRLKAFDITGVEIAGIANLEVQIK